MITLASGDSLGGTLQAAGSVTVMAYGESVPNGGGAPSGYYYVATLTTPGWVTLAGANAGTQTLINQVVAINGNASPVNLAVAQFPAVTGGWIAGGLNVGAPGAGYITIPPNGTAIHGRNGWRILTQYGNDVNVAQLGARCSAPTQALGAGGNAITSWSSFSPGTFATAAANGITLQREGSWFVSGSFRLMQNIEHYMALTTNGTMLLNDYPVGLTGGPSGTGISWSTIWAFNAGDLLAMNVWCATSPAAAPQVTTNLFAHWICPYR